ELVAPPFLAPLEREDVRRLHDPALVVEGLDLLLAQPLDVEGVARDEISKPYPRLCVTDEPSRAAPHRVHFSGPLIDLAYRMASANRAFGGKLVGLRAFRAPLRYNANDLRDDVSRPLDDDGVTDAHVLALDLVLVVKR